MRIRALLALAAILAIGSSAWTPAVAGFGYCMEPRAPSLFVTKPSKPICISGCSEWQVSAYKRDVAAYYDALRQYADDVDRYYKKAGEYIQCMADLD